MGKRERQSSFHSNKDIIFTQWKYIAQAKTFCEIANVMQPSFYVSQDVCILNLIHLQLFQSTGMKPCMS